MELATEQLTEHLIAELDELLELHYRECSAHQDIPLDPDWDRYHQMQDAGLLSVFTARDNAGELIGYAAFITSYNLHYRTSLQAVQDVVFLHPEHRNGTAGYLLLRYADRELDAAGVDVIYHHVKVFNDFSPVLERMGYAPVEKILAKRF